jgi:hypothetical protein
MTQLFTSLLRGTSRPPCRYSGPGVLANFGPPPSRNTRRAWVLETLVTPPSNTIASKVAQAAASVRTGLGIGVSSRLPSITMLLAYQSGWLSGVGIRSTNLRGDAVDEFQQYFPVACLGRGACAAVPDEPERRPSASAEMGLASPPTAPRSPGSPPRPRPGRFQTDGSSLALQLVAGCYGQPQSSGGCRSAPSRRTGEGLRPHRFEQPANYRRALPAGNVGSLGVLSEVALRRAM